jgi:hypothetical protein
MAPNKENDKAIQFPSFRDLYGTSSTYQDMQKKIQNLDDSNSQHNASVNSNFHANVAGWHPDHQPQQNITKKKTTFSQHDPTPDTKKKFPSKHNFPQDPQEISYFPDFQHNEPTPSRKKNHPTKNPTQNPTSPQPQPQPQPNPNPNPTPATNHHPDQLADIRYSKNKFQPTKHNFPIE